MYIVMGRIFERLDYAEIFAQYKADEMRKDVQVEPKDDKLPRINKIPCPFSQLRRKKKYE